MTNMSKLHHNSHEIATIHIISKISSHIGPTDSVLSADIDLSVKALCKLILKRCYKYHV